MKHKTIQQLRDSLNKVLKRGRPGQLKKLRKAYHGKRIKKWWSDYANAEGITIVECKDIEGVRNNGGMKGSHTHNHIYNKCNKHLFRGRSRRKIARKDKPEFVRIFHLNVKLGNVTKDSLMHTIFYHNKKEK